jgi:hypothetical protein
LLKSAGGLGHRVGFEERGGEVQESQKKAMEGRPAFSIRRDQHLRQEEAMRDKRHPGEDETREIDRLESLQSLAAGK